MSSNTWLNHLAQSWLYSVPSLIQRLFSTLLFFLFFYITNPLKSFSYNWNFWITTISLTNKTAGNSVVTAASLWLDKWRHRYQTRMNTAFFRDGYRAGRLVTSPCVISILTHFINLGKDTICSVKISFTGYTTKWWTAVFFNSVPSCFHLVHLSHTLLYVFSHSSASFTPPRYELTII